jgi:hypothetical protein
VIAQIASPNYAARRAPIQLLVLHATVGSFASAVAWFTNPASRVSAHYLIGKDGQIAYFVDEANAAWHAGKSRWQGVTVIDGSLNDASIGIELENRNNGSDPYPEAQYQAALALSQQIVARHGIARANVVRHLDISPGRKTDPRGFPWDRFVTDLFAPNPDAPICGPASGTCDQAIRYLTRHADPSYTDQAIAAIVRAYADLGTLVGLDWFCTLAQLAHETGNLTSFWSLRPQRNPAGIGVTGQTRAGQPHDAPPGTDWAYNPQRNQWEAGISFATWAEHAVPAHLGRLLAYARRDADLTGAQRALVDRALAVRPLPARLRGVAPRWIDLNGLWAVPGTTYGETIQRMAVQMREGA